MEKGSLARTRDTGRTSRLDGKGPAFQENEDDQAVNGNSAGSSSKKRRERPIIIEAQFKNVRDIGQENSGTGGKVPTSETELAQSINHLSESLKQIAASREQPEEMLKDSDRLDLIRNSIPPAELDMLKTLFNTLQSGGV